MRERDRRRFVRLCNDLIARMGGVRSHGLYQWELPTRYGRLGLTTRQDGCQGPGTVFTRFDEPHRVDRQINANPYSGKWNHHYFDGWTVEAAFADFECRLRSVLLAEDPDTNYRSVCSSQASCCANP